MTTGRLIYADPGLRDNLGHHANNCRAIIGEARSRGINTAILAFTGIDAHLREELRAIPFFRVMTPWLNDGDPICGWLNAFHIGADATREDLSRINDISANDIVYLSSALPAQLMGLVAWMATLPPHRVPHAVVEFGIDPGLDPQAGGKGPAFSIRDPRVDPRATLFRFAASRIPERIMPYLHMMTFDENSSAAFKALMGKPVGVLPTPRIAVAPRSRKGRRPITVAVLGHQRPEKGYQFMPEVAQRLLQSDCELRVLCHNADPAGMKEAQQALRTLAAADPRLILDERLAGDQVWAQLLDAADLIICPYPSSRFAISYSAIAVEAVANGIPLVVPAATTMARLVQEFGGAGAVFDRPEPSAIVTATRRALDRFDQLAAIAEVGVGLWAQIHGPRNLLDAMLRLAANSPPTASRIAAA
jgi:glycosyltransferase involved in cell wall biosynthesis